MRNNVFITPFVEAIHYHLHQNEMPSVELSVRLKNVNGRIHTIDEWRTPIR